MSLKLCSNLVYRRVESCGGSLLKLGVQSIFFGKKSAPHMDKDNIVSLEASVFEGASV